MERRVFVVAAVGILLFTGLAAVNAAYTDSVGATGDGNEVVNESFTVNQGNRTYLAESNQTEVVYNDTVSVYNENDTLVESNGNYSWATENGSLVVETGASALPDNTSANITYGWNAPTDEQKLARDVGTIPMQLGEQLLTMLGAVLVIAVLFLLANQAGGGLP